MRKLLFFVFPLLALLTLGGAVAAFADSPHFVSASADWQTAGGANIQVNWKESGLGDNLLISYVASAQSTATYACINGGGNHPSAANKETVSGPVSASGQFSSGKNGTVSAALSLAPISQGAFSCPSGQTLVLADVGYTDVQIADVTNGVSAGISGTFSQTFYAL